MIAQDPIILLVDDSETDRGLMSIVFKRIGYENPVHFACDGVAAIAYLSGDGVHADRKQFPMPTAVLLDLNMPGKNGFEVLAWIREQPALRRLRVYILTSSNLPEDIRRCQELGANSYLVKPRGLDGLTHLAKTLIAWLMLSPFEHPTGEVNIPIPEPALIPAITFLTDRAE